MSKYLLDFGHCLYGADTGAQGNGCKEQECTREIGYKVKSKLEALGHTVVIVSCDSANSLSESLAHRVNLANSSDGDLYISIHLNAGGGVGVEIYTYGAKQFQEAKNALNTIVGLGYTNRSIKDGSGLYVIKNTNMKAMLIECCFIDSSDMQKYNAENIASAIVKGLTGQTVASQPVSQPQVNIDNEVLKLQRVLNRLAMRDGKGNVLFEDGIIGTCTKEAIKRFQTICGLSVDGIAGPATWDAINRILAKPLLQIGSTGVVVRYLQYRIGVSYDGIFGNLTASNVRYWQSKNDLVSDGIVGNNTWIKLIG